jgi:predicted phage tail protein
LSQQIKEIRGSKGGSSKPRTPVESPDNLRSIAKAKILVALGEGEFAGTPSPQDIFLDDTPLANPSGGMNFPGVKWEYRSGSQDQDYIKGMPAVENEFSLNYELTNSLPYVRAVTDTSLSAVRVRFRWPMLQSQKDNGDLVGSSVTYAIDLSTDGGPYVTVLQESVSGKSTTGYERSRRIDLPDATTGWQIRVRRVSADSTSSNNINTTYVVGFTEIIDAKFRYPNTALLYVEFDATQFQNIPKISCKVKMREWPVPSNYDPETRTYTGIWDGTFKMAWTDNPVWVCNGILVNNRFGTGERITQDDIDKWELYRISQYCDVLVSDGKGGLEPRFTCNVYIQSKEDAWAVLRDLTSIYRGMVYWGQSKITSIADMPRDIDYIFTRSNVIDGKFQYSGGSEREVYTRAIVGYNNPDNLYEPDAVAVFDRDLQLRYGDNLLELTAMGCAKQSEAQRRGYWALYTNSKNRAVSFQVGLDGQIPMPGYVIGVADPLLAGQPLGGRVASVSDLNSVTLDRDTLAEAGDLLVVNLPSGIAQSRTILSVANNGRDITLTTNFSELPESEAQWAIEKEDLVIQQFRVTKVSRENDYTFTIEAVEHDPNKYARVDNGARLEERPITVIPPSVQAPPTDVQISTFTNVQQTMAVTTMRITWEPAANAVYYVVEWRKDDKDWIRMPAVGATSVDIEGVYTGNYIARVRAYNAVDVASLPASSLLTAVVGKEGTPPVLSSLTTTSKIFGIDLDWVFPTGATDTNYTEIQYNIAPSEIDVLLLGTFAYPLDTYTMAGLAAGQEFYFRARLVDKTGNIGAWTSWVVGQASSDPAILLDYLEGQIAAGQLAPGLIDELQADIADGIIDEVLEDISGPLTGDTEIEGTWYIGDGEEEGNNVGNVNLLTVINDGDYQLAKDVSVLFAENQTFSAAIQNIQEVFVNEFEAVASMVDTLAVQVGENEAVLTQTAETVATLDGELSSTWQVKTQVRSDGRVVQAGVALGASIGEGGVGRSEILLMADTIAFVNSLDGTLHAPFIFDTVGDAVYLNTAFIQEGTISTLMIGDVIESTNYNPVAKTGWQLLKNGNFTIYGNGGVGSGYTLITNENIKVFDENNTMRVRMGYLLS